MDGVVEVVLEVVVSVVVVVVDDVVEKHATTEDKRVKDWSMNTRTLTRHINAF